MGFHFTEFKKVKALLRLTKLVPQNPTPLTPGEVDNLRANLGNLLKGKCADFVARTLSELGKLTGTAPHSTDALKVFDAVRGQKGFHREAGTLTAFGYAYGSVGSGQGKIGVRLAPPGSPSNAFITNSETSTMAHELIHAARGSGGELYSHRQMAQAAYSAAQALGYKGFRPPGTDFTDQQNSQYFNRRLFDACKLK